MTTIQAFVQAAELDISFGWDYADLPAVRT